MKIIQKLEMIAGLTTLGTVLVHYSLFTYPYVKSTIEARQPVGELLFRGFMILIFPALLTALGSFVHAVKQDKSSLVILFIGGLLSTLLTTIGLLGMNAHSWLYNLLILLWGVFAIFTMTLAVHSKNQMNGIKAVASQSDKLSFQIIPRLEICAGAGMVIVSFLYIYLIDMPLSQRISEQNDWTSGYNWGGAFLFLIFPSLLISFSSYAHAYWRSKLALGVIIILGGIVTFLTAVSFLIGSAFEGHLFIGISPGLFALATIFFALLNTATSSPKTNNFP